jgi:hypothetical protein
MKTTLRYWLLRSISPREAFDERIPHIRAYGTDRARRTAVAREAARTEVLGFSMKRTTISALRCCAREGELVSG